MHGVDILTTMYCISFHSSINQNIICLCFDNWQRRIILDALKNAEPRPSIKKLLKICNILQARIFEFKCLWLRLRSLHLRSIIHTDILSFIVTNFILCNVHALLSQKFAYNIRNIYFTIICHPHAIVLWSYLPLIIYIRPLTYIFQFTYILCPHFVD